MSQSTDNEIREVLADEADPDRVMIERARSYLMCLDPEYAADLRRHEQEWVPALSRGAEHGSGAGPGELLADRRQ